jgi:hypothetical protein
VASPIQPTLRNLNIPNGGGFVVKMSCNLAVNCPTCREAVASDNKILPDSVAGSDILKVYPNPFTHETNIMISGSVDARYSVKIVNSLGIQVFAQDNVAPNEAVNLGENLESGLYLVQVTGNGKLQTARIIKTK